MTDRTTTNHALGITPGEARVPHNYFCRDEVTVNDIVAARAFGDNKGETEANARLYADAHNTANATGKLPSELAREREELMGALRGLLFQVIAEKYGHDAAYQMQKGDWRLWGEDVPLGIPIEYEAARAALARAEKP
jgi:hypothetical protein